MLLAGPSCVTGAPEDANNRKHVRQWLGRHVMQGVQSNTKHHQAEITAAVQQ
jgi:hypothetical protein